MCPRSPLGNLRDLSRRFGMARKWKPPLALAGWCVRAASDHPNAPTGERQDDDSLPGGLVVSYRRLKATAFRLRVCAWIAPSIPLSSSGRLRSGLP